MISVLNSRIKLILLDGRSLIGQMIAFDRYMNLVLADTEEFRKIKIKTGDKGMQEIEVIS